jgi:hypothetical protein
VGLPDREPPRKQGPGSGRSGEQVKSRAVNRGRADRGWCVLRHRKSSRNRPLATLEIHAQGKKMPAGNKDWKHRAKIRNTERQMSCSDALGHTCRESLAHPAFGRKESSKARGRSASRRTSNHEKLRFAAGENKIQVGNGGR